MSSHRKKLGKKFFVISGIVTLALSGGAAFAVTQVSAAAKPDAYGFCVSKVNGNVRALERGNLVKSKYGKCRTSETKVLVKEGTWLPIPIAVPLKKFTVKHGTPVVTEECTLDVITEAKPGPDYTCVVKP